MTSTTVTGSGAPTTRPVRETSFTENRAARELQLRRGEFDLAVRLGRIRTYAEPIRGPEQPGALGRRRVDRTEIDRLRATKGFPETLRASLRTDNATQGAREMAIAAARFIRLARLGFLVPVAFYVNRYRTVVWLYLAEELRDFAAVESHKTLLTGPLPETMRAQLDAGTDLRARNWRGRHAGVLQRLTDGPWARAAVTASLLHEDEIADVVDDPYERAYLAWLSPPRPDRSPPGSPAAQVVDELIKAGDRDEIDWFRTSLARDLAEARSERPAPRFAPSALPPCPSDPECARPEPDGSGAADTGPRAEPAPCRPAPHPPSLRRPAQPVSPPRGPTPSGPEQPEPSPRPGRLLRRLRRGQS